MISQQLQESPFRRRVCVVTWVGTENPGTNLQCFALQEWLINAGYDVVVLDSVPRAVPGAASSFTFGYYIRLFFFLIGLYLPWLRIKRCLFHTTVPERNGPYISCWIEHNIKCISVFFRWRLTRLLKETDMFISGSDQIWNTQHGFNPLMFLDFVKGKPKISYASSMGGEEIDAKYRQQIRHLLSDYSCISVRESSTVPALNALIGRTDVVTLVDPVFLLSRELWRTYASSGVLAKEKGKYLLVYLLHAQDGCINIIRDVAEKCRLFRIVYVSTDKSFVPPRLEPSDEVVNKVTPFDFVRLMLDATCVCTDSFHGISFSVNFNVPFVVLSQGACNPNDTRVRDVLALFKLSNRTYDANTSSWADALPDNLSVMVYEQRVRASNYLTDALCRYCH